MRRTGRGRDQVPSAGNATAPDRVACHLLPAAPDPPRCSIIGRPERRRTASERLGGSDLSRRQLGARNKPIGADHCCGRARKWPASHSNRPDQICAAQQQLEAPLSNLIPVQSARPPPRQQPAAPLDRCPNQSGDKAQGALIIIILSPTRATPPGPARRQAPKVAPQEDVGWHLSRPAVKNDSPPGARRQCRGSSSLQVTWLAAGPKRPQLPASSQPITCCSSSRPRPSALKSAIERQQVVASPRRRPPSRKSNLETLVALGAAANS